MFCLLKPGLPTCFFQLGAFRSVVGIFPHHYHDSESARLGYPTGKSSFS